MDDKTMVPRKPYTTPQVIEHGSVVAKTQQVPTPTPTPTSTPMTPTGSQFGEFDEF